MKFTLFASALWLLFDVPWQCIAFGVLADVVCSCCQKKAEVPPERRQPQRVSRDTRKDSQ